MGNKCAVCNGIFLLNFCAIPDLIQEEAASDKKTLQVEGDTATLEEG